MNIRYLVDLSEAKRGELQAMLGGGKHAVRKLKQAQILLAADVGMADETIASSVRIGGSIVYRTKRQFVEVISTRPSTRSRAPAPRASCRARKKRCLWRRRARAHPKAAPRRMIKLLAGEMVRLTDHDDLSRETVRRRLAENELKPWRQKMWCVPAVDGACVARMEDVLDLYAEDPDPKRPVVCFDESPVQLNGEARRPIPPAPGRLERYDYEYSPTAPSICSSPWMPISLGATSRSPSGAQPPTLPSGCAISSTSTFPTQTRSGWSGIICPRTRPALSTRPSPRPRPIASSAGWSST